VNYGSNPQRVGYTVVYERAHGTMRIEFEPWWKRPTTEARLGLITFGGGLIWATKVETAQFSNVLHLLQTRGPLDLSAIGLLIWLHAKWRKSVRLK